MICSKCKARLTDIQKELEDIAFVKYGAFTETPEERELPGPWDIATLAKRLHEVCEILKGAQAPKKETVQ